MWLERDEVERSIRELGLAEQLRAVPAEETEALYRKLEERFSTRQGARWIWEHLRVPAASRRFVGARAFERLARIVHASCEEILFFPGSDADAVCAFRGTIDAIVALIGDCFAFEYCIAPPGLEWLPPRRPVGGGRADRVAPARAGRELTTNPRDHLGRPHRACYERGQGVGALAAWRFPSPPALVARAW
jgi:hypothetical protein